MRIPHLTPTTGRLAGILLATLLATLAAPAVSAHHGSEHPILRIEVADTRDLVTFSYFGPFVVVHDGTAATITVPLPLGSTLDSFRPEDLSAEGTATATEGEAPVATFRYAGAGPAAGTRVNATLYASRPIRADDNVAVTWSTPEADEIFAVVLAPIAYGISQNAGLRQDIHGLATGPEVRRWTQSQLTVDTLQVILRPVPTGPDAAHADPPLPGLGWLVVLAVAGLAGGAWLLGHRSGRRREEGP